MATLNCPVCDEPFQPGDLLCMSCGANLARAGGAHRQAPGGYDNQQQGYPPQGPQQGGQQYGAPQQHGQPYQQAPQQHDPYQQQAPHQQPGPPGPSQDPWGPPQQQPPGQQPDPWGPPMPDQPQHGQPQHGQPQHGQPQHGQPQYGQPQNQQQGGQPQHGGQPPMPQQQPPGDPWGVPQQPQQQDPWGGPQAPQQQPPMPDQYQQPQDQQYAPPQDQYQQREPQYQPQDQYGMPQPGPGDQGFGPPPQQHAPQHGPPHGGGQSPMPPPHGREATLLPPDQNQGQQRPPGSPDSTAFMCPYCEAVLTNPAAAQCDSCLRPLPQQGTPILRVMFPTGELKVSVGQHLVLGRDAGQSPVASTFTQYDNVSRRHSTVWLDPSGTAWVRDEGSTNGTFVNGERLPRGVEAPLRNGDQLRLAADVTGTVQL
ncbi:FHA domain-containing protein [Actinomadura sp. KC345]|uniref:FHA domain-containing protein n=1 Tax=Actinomadura sp. KC345 TaxID=2530371 RepID=UPI00104435D2|nr:FHA domain-containing protein [Actinomadura sp. KC345]TDC44214.1 FHA domain-containing protein [Actinomadura sp. KC345]